MNTRKVMTRTESVYSNATETISDDSHQATNAAEMEDFICPICLDHMDNAYITKCGHSYWYFPRDFFDEKLSLHSLSPSVIPQMSNLLRISHHERNIPKLYTKVKSSRETIISRLPSVVDRKLSVQDIDVLLKQLHQQRASLQSNHHYVTNWIMKKIINRIKTKKIDDILKAVADLEYVKEDLRNLGVDISTENLPVVFLNPEKEKEAVVPRESSKKRKFEDVDFDEFDLKDPLFSEHDYTRAKTVLSKLLAHFEEIEDLYYKSRQELVNEDNKAENVDFAEKIENISKYVDIRSVQKISHKQSTVNPASMSYLISSIDFDKDDEFFAAAGVEKKIQIYDYNNILTNRHEHGMLSGSELRKQMSRGSITPVSSTATLFRRRSLFSRTHSSNSIVAPLFEQDNDVDECDDIVNHSLIPIPTVPIREIPCAAKISCISWSPYIKNQIAGSDYEGHVHLWDSLTGKVTMKFDEHEKRVWAIDYCLPTPTFLCSAGDDCKVKLWSTNCSSSVATINSKVSICSVKFNPEHRHELAFGSADHKIYYYDIRNTKEPMAVFTSHPKAVSYIRFFNGNEMLSASTDCTLRSWKLPPTLTYSENFKTSTVKSFSKKYHGHKNEKNFVGLAINKSGSYIATGSEENNVYVYSKELENPWIVAPFGPPSTFKVNSDIVQPNTHPHFVSAVAWNKSLENHLICGNSAGMINCYEFI